MVEQEIVSKNRLISSLMHIGHGDFNIYKDIGISAARSEPELFAHFLCWNTKNGEVRDSKAALPVCALRGKGDVELFENAVANLCTLDPRNLLRAVLFHKKLHNNGGSSTTPGAGKFLKEGVKRYLEFRHNSRPTIERAMLQHRSSLKALYALYHIKPTKFVQEVLFERKNPKGTVFEKLANLKNMSPKEAAGAILNSKIPFLIATGALGGIKGKPDVILALIEGMSGNELVANTNALTNWGVFENQALTAAYDDAIKRAKSSKKTSTLKAGKVKAKSKKAAGKLKDLQTDKLDKLGGIDGDWLVLGDKSGSMQQSVEIAKHISALIAQQVKGNVYLVFFHQQPQFFDVSGKSFDEICDMTKRVYADGATSIGVGIDYILQRGYIVNGIVIVSDGGENRHPSFYNAYCAYADKFGIEPTVYHLHVPGDSNRLLHSKIQIERFDLGYHVDYYSLPNIIKALKTNRYQLVDDIMEISLLTFNDVFKIRRRERL